MKDGNQNTGSPVNPQAQSGSEYEIIDSVELARRWRLPETWVRGHVLQGVSDSIPHLRFGRYVRFRWGSPELNSWLERRTVTGDHHTGEEPDFVVTSSSESTLDKTRIVGPNKNSRRPGCAPLQSGPLVMQEEHVTPSGITTFLSEQVDLQSSD